MRYLAINTAAPVIEVAAIFDDVEKFFTLEKVMAAEQLLPAIDGIADEMHVKLGDFDSFVCVIGPGSFTGIRIGVNTVRAFAYALKKKAYGVTYGRLMAYNINGGAVTFADGGGEVCYAAAYDGDKTVDGPVCMYKRDAERYYEKFGFKAISDFDLPFCTPYKPNLYSMKKAAEFAIKNDGDTQPLYIRKPQPDRKESDI